jgi:hypothetical protein
VNDPLGEHVFPAHDDTLDDGLRTALLPIDRGPALGVDVEEVLHRGRRHRRVLVAERGLAMAAVAAVVVGIGVFGLGRGPAGAPDPSPPAASQSPSVTQVAPVVRLGSSVNIGSASIRRGVLWVDIYNGGAEAVTIGSPRVEASGARVRAALTPVAAKDEHVFTTTDASDRLTDLPGPASITVAAGHLTRVAISIDPACTSADTAISADVRMSLLSASGGTGELVVSSAQGPTEGWISATVQRACLNYRGK